MKSFTKGKKGKNRAIIIMMSIIAVIACASLYFIFIGNMETVCVANKTARTGTQITKDMITTKTVDKSNLPDNYVPANLKDKLIGAYVDVGLTKGSAISQENIAMNGKASMISKGYTLYCINELKTYPEGIVAGDSINILCGTSLSETGKSVITFQKVTVTNVNKNSDGEVIGIEVEVTPEQAQKIAYAQANGTLSLALVPNGYTIEDLPILNESGLQ